MYVYISVYIIIIIYIYAICSEKQFVDIQPIQEY
jgi:hypothetical protein